MSPLWSILCDHVKKKKDSVKHASTDSFLFFCFFYGAGTRDPICSMLELNPAAYEEFASTSNSFRLLGRTPIGRRELDR